MKLSGIIEVTQWLRFINYNLKFHTLKLNEMIEVTQWLGYLKFKPTLIIEATQIMYTMVQNANSWNRITYVISYVV